VADSFAAVGATGPHVDAVCDTSRYLRADASAEDDLRRLLDGLRPPLIVYFALPPRITVAACRTLAGIGLPEGTRLVLEKPFGTDAGSAAALNDLLSERYPGVDDGSGYPVIRYSEGLEIGYRWFQAQRIEPLFGLGFGLSYTTFDITDVSVDAPAGADAPVVVTALVTNTGPVVGAEVVQVYLGIPVDGQPPKRLVGFHRVFVEPGESALVRIPIDPAATNHPFGVWDYCTRAFVTKPGDYTVYVGNSADDTPHAVTLTVG
jgi:Fibronectin type III-like domain/Glucose-6-phosphate dehydrogenase, NAD binding domain